MEKKLNINLIDVATNDFNALTICIKKSSLEMFKLLLEIAEKKQLLDFNKEEYIFVKIAIEEYVSGKDELYLKHLIFDKYMPSKKYLKYIDAMSKLQHLTKTTTNIKERCDDIFFMFNAAINKKDLELLFNKEEPLNELVKLKNMAKKI